MATDYYSRSSNALSAKYRSMAKADFPKAFQEMRKKGWDEQTIAQTLGIPIADIQNFVKSGQYPGTFSQTADNAGVGDTTGGTTTGGTTGGNANPQSSVDYPATGSSDTTTAASNQFLDAFNQMSPDWSTFSNDPEKAAVELQQFSLENALLGRKAGVEELRQFQQGFANDPFLAALEGKSSELMNTPLFNEQDIAGLIGGYDARLSQSYGNQANALSTSLGQRGIGGDSGVAQELQNALRFQTLQAGAQNEQQLRTSMKQMNRSALEDALRLGLATSGFKSGIQAQTSGNIANLLAGESLTQNFQNTGASMAALAAPDSGGSFNPLDLIAGAVPIVSDIYQMSKKQ